MSHSATQTRRKHRSRQGRQCAALPLRERDGTIQVLLVTSRETRRWVLPKGWTEAANRAAEQAAVEAFEEAGIRGDIAPTPIGSYDYEKRIGKHRSLPCRVEVFPMRVAELLEDWPERAERERRWFSLTEAAQAVEEGGLGRLMLQLAQPEA
ncbi:NUDIX hydrolase [Siccirubricoccus sp. KC 17139]|uniref:NUDIX hydrolase n=1 Tax=Siccirubricoccus soli TaxID=2899147 RepID=A0ABT1D586_9PROT|nr:NUDIX hydrolase [Siccirubricoccus soli]MCO6417073.1 NUDIX hydrolase [Siccirubricoccus soli]MCP2683208.1 NUDIX hydrolase [Siccirubricoccus soli]